MNERSSWGGLLATILLLGLSLTSAAEADNARLGALGVDNDVLLDPANVYTYPSNVIFWSGLITAEVAKDYQGPGGYHLWGATKIGAVGVLGIGFGGWPYNPWLQGDWPLPEAEALSLFWGSEIGDGMAAGASLSYASGGSLYEDGNTGGDDTYSSTIDDKNSLFSFRVGGHMQLGPLERVDVSTGYTKGSSEEFAENKYKYGNSSEQLSVEEDEWEGSSYNLRARGFLPRGSATLIPSFSVLRGSADENESDLSGTNLDTGWGEETEWKYRSYAAQLGARLDVNEGTQVLASIGFRTRSSDTESGYLEVNGGEFDPGSAELVSSEDRTTFMPYAAVGVEMSVRNWFMLRAGAQKYQYKNTYESVTSTWEETSTDVYEIRKRTNKDEWRDSWVSITYGFGVRVGKFALDAVLDNDFIYNWGYISSGIERSPVVRATLNYSFDQ